MKSQIYQRRSRPDQLSVLRRHNLGTVLRTGHTFLLMIPASALVHQLGDRLSRGCSLQDPVVWTSGPGEEGDGWWAGAWLQARYSHSLNPLHRKSCHIQKLMESRFLLIFLEKGWIKVKMSAGILYNMLLHTLFFSWAHEPCQGSTKLPCGRH